MNFACLLSSLNVILSFMPSGGRLEKPTRRQGEIRLEHGEVCAGPL
jgi:hypothetical protein